VEGIMKKIRKLILPALFATFLISCVTQNGAKRTEEKSEIPKEKSGEVTQQKPTVYYAGTDGLKLYAQPAISKDHILELPLNEKLLRYKTSKGFAYVKVVSTGQVGWVDNGQLEWKKVITEKKPGQEIGEEPPPSKEVGEKTKEKRSGPGILKPAEAEAAPVPATTPQAIEKPKKPDASVLDAL
jgi:hypothetical protein